MTSLAAIRCPNLTAAPGLIRTVLPKPATFTGPIHLRDSRGLDLPTQTSPVTCGPAGEVRTVEMLALGSGQSFTVEAGVGPAAAAISSAPMLVLESRDHAGTIYSAQIVAPKVTRSGAVARTTEGGGSFEAGGKADFLHYKASVTRVAGCDYTLLDLFIHNGCVTAPLNGDLYFDSLVLKIPAGYIVSSALPAPWLSQDGTLVRANTDGTLHLMPQQGTMRFRLAIHKPGDAAALSALRVEGIGVPVPGAGWSWSDPETAHYFPQCGRMPNNAGVGASVWNNEPHGFAPQTILSALATGSAAPNGGGSNWGAAGPWHAYFDSNGNGGSGQGILQYDGLGLLHTGRLDKLHELMALDRMNGDRHRTALYESDGSVVRAEDKPTGWKTVAWPGQMWGGKEGFVGWKFASQWRRDAVTAQGKLPSYDGYLRSFANYDFAHGARYYSTLLALAYLLNDTLAKWQIDVEAEWARMWCYETGPSVLAEWQAFAQQWPGKGNPSPVREYGWALTIISARYQFSTDPQRRARFAAWADTVVSTAQRAQLPSGSFEAVEHSSGQKPASNFPGHAVRQSIEDDILGGGLRAVYAAFGDFRIPSMLVKLAVGQCTYHHKDGIGGPLWQHPVRPDDRNLPAYTSPPNLGFIPLSVDNAQTGTALSNALLVEPANAILVQRANEMLGSNPHPTNNAHSRSPLLAWKQGGVVVPPPVDPPPTRPPPTGTRPPPTDPPATRPPPVTEPPRTDPTRERLSILARLRLALARLSGGR